MKKNHFLNTGDSCNTQRRNFIKQGMLLGSSILIYGGCEQEKEEVPLFAGQEIPQGEFLEGLKKVDGPDYVKGASWYEGENPGDGISFSFPAGSLSSQKYITADMLAYGTHMIKFMIIKGFH